MLNRTRNSEFALKYRLQAASALEFVHSKNIPMRM
jgi:hypothetical protein